MINKIKQLDLAAWTMMIGAIYLIAWFSNGYLGMKFSCSDLVTFYTIFVVQRLGAHTINSAFNSAKGEMPLEDKCPPSKTDR